MTRRATYGDFADQVTARLARLPGPRTRIQPAVPPARHIADITAGLRAVLPVMARHVVDATAVFDAMPPAERPAHAPWIQAARRSRDVLARVAAHLQVSRPVGDQAGAERSMEFSDLAAAAESMTLARDLLRTHAGPRTGRDPVASEWEPVVSSVPLARARLLELGGWARAMARHASHTAVSAQRGSNDQRQRVAAAAQWLWTVDRAVTAAHERQPVTIAELDLLHAIPVCALPARQIPGGTETTAEMCRSAVTSAERARHAARRAAAEATWSPAMTMESLRDSAAYCTVISWNCRTILQTLAGSDQAASHDLASSLNAAAEAADEARAAWLETAGTWDILGTDTRGARSQTVTDLSDLALWTGRLAYADPAWTPALGPSSAARSADDMLQAPGDLPRVVAAVHHTCHSLTRIAQADHALVETAGDAGRLLIPTRSLPERLDVPYRFAKAPDGRTASALARYQEAVNVNDRATNALAELAAETQASSQAAATAQAVTTGSSALPAPGHRRSGNRAVLRAPQPDPPGPVERILLDLDVTSPVDLAHARAIDTAAEQLINRAATENQFPRLPQIGNPKEANYFLPQIMLQQDLQAEPEA